MKFTNEQIGNYVDIMTNINESGKLGYAIAKNLRKMSDEAKEYLDLKSNLIQKYGKITPNGNGYMINPACPGFDSYIEEISPIASIEVDVDVFKVDEKTFYSGNLNSRQMADLMWMVE